MTRRTYTETAYSFSPFNQAVLQGLGATQGPSGWPKGRTYVGIAHFRAPHAEFGYMQDNTLQGLGDTSTNYQPTLGAVQASEMDAVTAEAPGNVKRFLLSGEPVPELRKNVTLPFNQVHPYVYGVLALAAGAASYMSYKTWKKTHKA